MESKLVFHITGGETGFDILEEIQAYYSNNEFLVNEIKSIFEIYTGEDSDDDCDDDSLEFNPLDKTE